MKLARGVGIALLGLVLAGLLAAGTERTSAAAPEGPRIGAFKVDFESERWALVTFGPRGGSPESLVGAKRGAGLQPLLESPAWLPDGRSLIFAAAMSKVSLRAREPHLYVIRADGSGLRRIPGTRGASGPVVSPDGERVAFTRVRTKVRYPTQRHPGGLINPSSAAWIAGIGGEHPRRLTPWRNDLENRPSSFSPDGSIVTLNRTVGEDRQSIVGLQLDGTGERVIARNARDGTYSPDGSKLAFVRLAVKAEAKAGGGDIHVLDLSSGAEIAVTKSPGVTEFGPSWDPSGQRLAFSEVFWVRPQKGEIPIRIALGVANADGSCHQRIGSSIAAPYLAPAWQPGPGREAGRIAC